ncbi:hypothetical protein RB195_025361 [Necator americanus]|uniref:Uncharacterized protein n=1 Tax=Necator americanus TaxID=51031 RepID=A0ABR1ERY6_NECAM
MTSARRLSQAKLRMMTFPRTSFVYRGEIFIQVSQDLYQSQDLDVYYSAGLIEIVCNDLQAIIGEGMRKLNPITISNRMDKGQLYYLLIQTVVPILDAVTRHKNVGIYRRLHGNTGSVSSCGFESSDHPHYGFATT